jgi:hypothetical protein
VVKDSSQGAFPSAKITTTSEETAINETTLSNLQGYYNFAFLRPGSYAIKVEAAGFRTITRLGVNLEVGQEGRLDFVLKPATLRQTITVKDSAPSVRSDSTGVSTAIDRQFVDKLSLNGRTFQPLIALVPGIVMTNGDGQFSTNGQRDNANYFTLDSVSANIGISYRFSRPDGGGRCPDLMF